MCSYRGSRHRPLCSVDVFYGLCCVRAKVVDVVWANILLCPEEDWRVIKFQWSINKDLFYVTRVFSLLSLSLPLGVKQPVFLLPPWSPTFRAGLERKSVSIFRLSTWAFCCSKADSFGALDEREWEREGGGENIFYSTSVCVYYAFIWWNLIPAVQPTVPSAAAAPLGLLPILS